MEDSAAVVDAAAAVAVRVVVAVDAAGTAAAIATEGDRAGRVILQSVIRNDNAGPKARVIFAPTPSLSNKQQPIFNIQSAIISVFSVLTNFVVKGVYVTNSL